MSVCRNIKKIYNAWFTLMKHLYAHIVFSVHLRARENPEQNAGAFTTDMTDTHEHSTFWMISGPFFRISEPFGGDSLYRSIVASGSVDCGISVRAYVHGRCMKYVECRS